MGARHDLATQVLDHLLDEVALDGGVPRHGQPGLARRASGATPAKGWSGHAAVFLEGRLDARKASNTHRLARLYDSLQAAVVHAVVQEPLQAARCTKS
jgi:hypothetical protein